VSVDTFAGRSATSFVCAAMRHRTPYVDATARANLPRDRRRSFSFKKRANPPRAHDAYFKGKKRRCRRHFQQQRLPIASAEWISIRRGRPPRFAELVARQLQGSSILFSARVKPLSLHWIRDRVRTQSDLPPRFTELALGSSSIGRRKERLGRGHPQLHFRADRASQVLENGQILVGNGHGFGRPRWWRSDRSSAPEAKKRYGVMGKRTSRAARLSAYPIALATSRHASTSRIEPSAV
jgi:hypothetical protein